jgi:hypothetical protein
MVNVMVKAAANPIATTATTAEYEISKGDLSVQIGVPVYTNTISGKMVYAFTAHADILALQGVVGPGDSEVTAVFTLPLLRFPPSVLGVAGNPAPLVPADNPRPWRPLVLVAP